MNQLKQVRKEKRLTQTEIANLSNISVRAYQQYESDKRIPNVVIANRIAEALGSTTKTLFLQENASQSEKEDAQ